MHPWKLPAAVGIGSICLLIAAAIFGLAHPEAPAGDVLPRLDRIRGNVAVLRHGTPLQARAGMGLQRRDRLATGSDGRAVVAFANGSRLMVGSDTEIELSDYLPEAGRRRTTLLLDVLRGAFQLVMNETAGGPQPNVQVRTQVASMIVHGKDLWSGPIDGTRGIVSMTGQVEVRNGAGSVMLHQARHGTMMRGSQASPDQPRLWSDEKITRALTAVAFE